jgi:uncharacterized RDD family membrane protein YckC
MDPHPPNELNPYAPPASDVNPDARLPSGDQFLAERSTRLGAALIDGGLIAVPVLLALVIGGLLSDQDTRNRNGSAFLVGALVAGAWWLGFSIFQCVRISTTGQSLGKKWTGIKIVRSDGSPVTFGSGVGMRNWLPSVIAAVPYLGSMFWLVDVAMIFREDRRCLHDQMADTKVIVVGHAPL